MYNARTLELKRLFIRPILWMCCCWWDVSKIYSMFSSSFFKVRDTAFSLKLNSEGNRLLASEVGDVMWVTWVNNGNKFLFLVENVQLFGFWHLDQPRSPLFSFPSIQLWHRTRQDACTRKWALGHFRPEIKSSLANPDVEAHIVWGSQLPPLLGAF